MESPSADLNRWELAAHCVGLYYTLNYLYVSQLAVGLLEPFRKKNGKQLMQRLATQAQSIWLTMMNVSTEAH